MWHFKFLGRAMFSQGPVSKVGCLGVVLILKETRSNFGLLYVFKKINLKADQVILLTLYICV